jgi:hypothetical protein
MYPRSKFQELLLDVRQAMAREADFDLDLFVEKIRKNDFRSVKASIISRKSQSEAEPRTLRKGKSRN